MSVLSSECPTSRFFSGHQLTPPNTSLFLSLDGFPFYLLIFYVFFPHAAGHAGSWLPKIRLTPPCTGSSESYPLDCQASSRIVLNCLYIPFGSSAFLLCLKFLPSSGFFFPYLFCLNTVLSACAQSLSFVTPWTVKPARLLCP